MKLKSLVLSGLVVVVATLVIAVSTVAQSPQQTPNQPPAVAIAACKGKEVGTPCQFQIPQGRTIEGTCKTVKTQFLCLPDNLPNQGAPNQGN